MQLRDEAVEPGGDVAPILLGPVARKAQRYIGSANEPFVDARPGHHIAGARAARIESVRLVGDVDEVLGFVGRTAAERQNGETVVARSRLRLDVMRVDAAQPLKRVAAMSRERR